MLVCYVIIQCLPVILHQNLERDTAKEQDFRYTEAILLKNSSKNRKQKPLPRKNICKFTILLVIIHYQCS